MGDSFEVAEVTDSLEALGVFRFWKNAFLVIIIVSTLATQCSFWLVDIGLVGVDAESGPHTVLPVDANASLDSRVASLPGENGQTDSYAVTFDHLAHVVRIANGTAIMGAILYCLTLQSCMIITVVGRLGGSRHVCRAFFLALVMLVLLLPWQHIFGSFVLGMLYRPEELIVGHAAKTEGLFALVLYYLRFCGLWLVCMLLLLASLFKCSHWARSILRRLEII